MTGLASLVVSGTLAAGLGAYNVDPNSVSVSGLSAGGFMAAQLGVAYSDTFKTGFGIFAGGPYDCARNQLVRYQMCLALVWTAVMLMFLCDTVQQLHEQSEPIHHKARG